MTFSTDWILCWLQIKIATFSSDIDNNAFEHYLLGCCPLASNSLYLSLFPSFSLRLSLSNLHPAFNLCISFSRCQSVNLVEWVFDSIWIHTNRCLYVCVCVNIVLIHRRPSVSPRPSDNGRTVLIIMSWQLRISCMDCVDCVREFVSLTLTHSIPLYPTLSLSVCV